MSSKITETSEASDRQKFGSERTNQPNPHLVRIAGWLSLVGGLLAIGFFLIRPQTPAYTGNIEPILEVFATNGLQFEIHTLGISVAILFVLGGFLGLKESFRGEDKAAAYGQLGLIAAIVTTALFLLDTSIDGTVLVETARMWAAAPPGEEASVRYVGELGMLLNVVILGRGVFLFELTIFLFGLGVASSTRFSRRLGVAGVVIGAFGMVTGAGIAIQGVPSMLMILPVFITLILAFAWVSVTGWSLRKRSREMA